MNKNLKLVYLLTFILSIVIVAWNTLSNFFGGVGINYITLLVCVAIMISMVVADKQLFNRTKDLFFASCVLTSLESIVYLPNEFGACKNPDVAVVFFNFQNVFTLLGLLLLIWLLFRFLTEYQNVRIHFVEVLLGNEKRVKKDKKHKPSKELSNGSLAQKPNTIIEDEEIEIIDNKSDEV